MTPARARTLALRWLVTAAAAMVLQIALTLSGRGVLGLVVGIAGALCLGRCWHWLGWASGYRERNNLDVRERLDPTGRTQ
jgi:hypothetical protein